MVEVGGSSSVSGVGGVGGHLSASWIRLNAANLVHQVRQI
jgi:hypothetical protein